MKLHSLEIKNFRAIEDISLDFTDLLSRPRPINLIVGPNGSGKTSIVELHLHPAWQKRLIQILREDDSNNQYIFTTHSRTVAEIFYDSEIINLGDLG
jgi:predicted ATP-dependent endonuclease of OLD family